MEMKEGRRYLVDGNVIEDSWADGQTGFCVVIGVRTCSGGAACGIYDPVSGLPSTFIDNVRFSNNWVRNCPQPIAMENRSSLVTGDGGGVSGPGQDLDFINTLFSNVGDDNQFGNPANEWEWTSGSNPFTCVMSRASNVATATCLPTQTDISNHVTGISAASNVVTIAHGGIRLDPFLCSGSPSTCIANGQSITIINHTGWNGTFAMTGTKRIHRLHRRYGRQYRDLYRHRQQPRHGDSVQYSIYLSSASQRR
jgi:hypothetical protein